MKKVLVTGANGYIGRYVVRALLDIGCKVVAVDLCKDGIDSRAEYLDYDIFSADENIYNTLGRPDVLVHLAWKDGFVHNSFSHLEYLPKHYDFIEKMVDGGLKHLSVMGSMHEVGYIEGAIDENSPTNPKSLYGISKNALRQSLEVMAASRSLVFQWLRGFYIYGDDKRSNSVFAKLLQKAEAGEKTFPFTTGKNQFDFIEVSDLALQIALASTQESVIGIINCCSGRPVSLGDRVEEFIREKKLEIRLEYGAYPDRAYDSPVIYGDCTKIRNILEQSLENEWIQQEAVNKLLNKIG